MCTNNPSLRIFKLIGYSCSQHFSTHPILKCVNIKGA